MTRRKKEVKEVQEVVAVESPVKAVDSPPVDQKYKNTLGGTLKVEGVVFPGKGEVFLTEEQASTKRMKHAIDCGVVVKV